jgi:hypothetical protein
LDIAKNRSLCLASSDYPVAVNPEYWRLITHFVVKQPTVYILDYRTPVFVEDKTALRAVIMPLALSEEDQQELDTWKGS